MSREIELKVPLKKDEFEKIQEILLKKKAWPFLEISSREHILKSDEYYSKYASHEERKKNNELRVIRIRSENKLPLDPSLLPGSENIPAEKKSYFCIKNKQIKNGIEFNCEEETYIENPDVLRAFFEASHFIKWFSKTKDSLSVICSLPENPEFKAHLELEKVNDLFYAEIEYTKDDYPPEIVRENLEKILLSLEINPVNRDSRSWIEILAQKS